MPSTTYTRQDYAIRITRAGEQAEVVANGLDGSVNRLLIPRDVVDRAARGDDAGLRSALSVPSITPIPRWGAPTLARLTIEVGERAWAAIPFESVAPAGTCVVRTSPVYSTVAQWPLSFPIRVLETGGPVVVPAALEHTFRNTYRDYALIEGQTTLGAAEDFLKENGWTTAEILHVHDFSVGAASLSTVSSEPSSVGWLLRLASQFRTRLIIIQAGEAEISSCRVVAQSIIDRGGPAVWLIDDSPGDCNRLYGDLAHDRPLDWIHAHVSGELFACDGAVESLRYSTIGEAFAQPAVVESVVRAVAADFPNPIRSVLRGLRSRVSSKATTEAAVAAVIAGAARTLRIPVEDSTIRSAELWGTRPGRFGDVISEQLARHGLEVQDLDTHLTTIRDHGGSLTFDDIAYHVRNNSRPLAQMNRRAARGALSNRLLQIARDMPTYRFEDHESDGMLPLAGKVAVARAMADALVTRARRARPGPRHVNTMFCAATGEAGALQQIPQASARLKRNELVHFGVQVGPKDTSTVTLGSTLLLEQNIQWEGDGAWIEIGLTPIDFDVMGDPVRQIWLPRVGPTDLMTFAVRPRATTTVDGMARLRFAVYHRNNVLQSFLVVARLEGETQTGDPATAFARALNATLEDVRSLGRGDLGYVARLEYATAPVGEVASPPSRGLAIIANDSAGDKVVTIKGDDLFTVRIDPTLPEKVKLARAALDSASCRDCGTEDPKYRYTFSQRVNEGDPGELLDVLWDIAKTGFGIFNLLVPDLEDQKRVAVRAAKGGGIHAAHIDASSVIPWSLVYDRPVIATSRLYEDPTDPNSLTCEVARGVCPASMPALDGTMPDVECGGAGCLLNAADNEQRKSAGHSIYIEDTVICPRRFWGFLAPIEVPAQQVTDLTAVNGPRMLTEVTSDQPVTVVAGFNPTLTFAKTHKDSLEQEVFVTKSGNVATTRATLVAPAFSGGEPLRQLLLKRQPDIVYFYCHALATLTAGGKTIGPSLDFDQGHKGVLADVLVANEFAGAEWTHAPLVFINGCSTAGFSPYAPSEFIAQFIRGRHAAAVIGTEVAIWEALATDIASSFLYHFLNGKNAGEALLRARRTLLARNNPLGLVYTLYGSSGLALKQH